MPLLTQNLLLDSNKKQAVTYVSDVPSSSSSRLPTLHIYIAKGKKERIDVLYALSFLYGIDSHERTFEFSSFSSLTQKYEKAIPPRLCRENWTTCSCGLAKSLRQEFVTGICEFWIPSLVL